MHLVENYALVCGCKIDRPFIKTKPIELPNKPYILLHAHNPKGKDRNYRHWNKVVSMLSNYTKFEHEIIQIGQQNDPIVNGVNSTYLGRLNYNELAYLVEHCDLLLCFDSFPMHLASTLDKKIVAVFGRQEQNTRPYFNVNSPYKVFAPSFEQYKPSFNDTDKFDLLNQIQPKEIFDATINLLGIA